MRWVKDNTFYQTQLSPLPLNYHAFYTTPVFIKKFLYLFIRCTKYSLKRKLNIWRGFYHHFYNWRGKNLRNFFIHFFIIPFSVLILLYNFMVIKCNLHPNSFPDFIVYSSRKYYVLQKYWLCLHGGTPDISVKIVSTCLLLPCTPYAQIAISPLYIAHKEKHHPINFENRIINQHLFIQIKLRKDPKF